MFLLLAGLCTHLPAQVRFAEGSLQAAFDQAAREGKPLFVEAYADWCGPCRLMARETFSDAGAAAYYNEHFVSYKLDADDPAHADFLARYRVVSIPHLLYFDARGELLFDRTGFFPPHLFLKLGRRAQRMTD